MIAGWTIALGAEGPSGRIYQCGTKPGGRDLIKSASEVTFVPVLYTISRQRARLILRELIRRGEGKKLAENMNLQAQIHRLVKVHSGREGIYLETAMEIFDEKKKSNAYRFHLENPPCLH